ncbi:MAG: TonB-dependent receptor [Alistipes sp.]|nr:TonB-dependent receptor [Alistipes sp.]
MKKILSVLILMLAICTSALAQNKTIKVSGTVTDEQNQPLIGVNVTIQGVTGFGTTTDVDGKYTIEMEPYNRLVFSYIGFIEQEILIKEQTKQNVVMKEDDATSLDEVVITGTGAQKKLTVTGAVTQIKMEDIATTSTSNITNMLAGNVPGVMAMQSSGQPGQNTSEFWVRGISTFGAGSSALVLVDGFPRDLNEISIEDIESFTVLKDASTTAIYGSKGANGVVLITTKKGKAGKVNVDAKFEAAYNTRTMTPEFADGYSYASMMNEALITRNQEPEYSPEELQILKLGLDPDLYPNVDWQELLLRDGAMTYRGQLSLSGGGNTARYFISGSYLNEQGMYKVDENIKKDYDTNANSQLYNYRMNVDVDITKTTLVKVGISGSLRKMNEPGRAINVWEALMRQNPIEIPAMYSDGRFPTRGIDADTNPWVLTTQTGYNETWTNKIQTNITLEQKLDFITKGLSFVGRFGFDTNNNSNIRRKKMPELYKANKQRNENGELVFNRIAAEEKMSQESGSGGSRYEYLEAEIHYNRSFKDHNVGATVKYTQNSSIATVGIGGDIINGIARRNQGMAGRVSYNWKNRYFADFNFGYNGSENFAKGHQYGFFPAMSAAWNVAEEGFIRNNAKWINMFKIRYSYGKVGNDNLGSRFPYLYTIANRESSYQWADLGYNKSYTGMGYTALANNYVTWEVATKHDLGIDLALFNDKFSLTVDYFNESREGIYMSRNYVSSMVGLNGLVPTANVGKVDSEGFDGNFALRHKFGEWDLTLRGNITYSKNTIIDRDEENAYYKYQLQKGYRVNQARGLIAMGMFKDYDDIRNSPRQDFGDVMPGDIKYKDVNGDGVVDGGDVVAIGATEKPNLIYGVGLSARWKNFDFNIHFQGAGKSSYCIQGPSVYAFSAGVVGNILPDLVNGRWIDSTISGTEATMNTNASYPRLSYGGNSNNYRASTFWLRNGSYLRLKTLEIGYNLPQKWVNKIYSKNIRVFFIGSNLLTFSDFKLWDPEMGSTTGTHYPLAKTFSFGFNLSM